MVEPKKIRKIFLIKFLVTQTHLKIAALTMACDANFLKNRYSTIIIRHLSIYEPYFSRLPSQYLILEKALWNSRTEINPCPAMGSITRADYRSNASLPHRWFFPDSARFTWGMFGAPQTACGAGFQAAPMRGWHMWPHIDRDHGISGGCPPGCRLSL